MKTKINRTSWKSVTLAVTASLLMSGVASAQPTPTPAPVTVSLPIASLDNSVPIATVIIQPVVTTNIDPSLNYIGFQGDFTFDETVVTFSTPFVEAAGLTATGWTVAGNILPGPGPIRTLRVSAFSNDGFTPLNGSGTLYNLRMLRVSSTPGASTALTWAAGPEQLSLHRRRPEYACAQSKQWPHHHNRDRANRDTDTNRRPHQHQHQHANADADAYSNTDTYSTASQPTPTAGNPDTNADSYMPSGDHPVHEPDDHAGLGLVQRRSSWILPCR